jgi:hypothetical protein
MFKAKQKKSVCHVPSPAYAEICATLTACPVRAKGFKFLMKLRFVHAISGVLKFWNFLSKIIKFQIFENHVFGEKRKYTWVKSIDVFQWGMSFDNFQRAAYSVFINFYFFKQKFCKT